jgi:hypothetical protein
LVWGIFLQMETAEEFLIQTSTRNLAGALEKTFEKSKGVLVLDFGFPRNFARNRLNGRQHIFTLSEIWAILSNSFGQFVGLDFGKYDVTFPEIMIKETQQLRDLLTEEPENSHRALGRLFGGDTSTFDLGRNFVDRSYDSRRAASFELARYIEVLDEVVALASDRLTEDRISPRFFPYKDRIKEALSTLGNRENYQSVQRAKIRNLGGPKPRHDNRNNDFDVMASVLTLSYTEPYVTACVADYDYILMSDYLAEREKDLAEAFGFPPLSPGTVKILRDKKKETRAIRTNKRIFGRI